MTTRKTELAVGEIYHIYNRGVDKRDIFMDPHDSERFLRSMIAFNTVDPIRNLRDFEHSGLTAGENPLVDIVAYCLNPNHFHLILRQVSDGGISEFMKRLSGGYTWYFNNKHDRSGSLFQGTYKSVHVDVNEYLLHLSVYVNLNFQVHEYSGLTAGIIRSSWDEYGSDFVKGICVKDSVLGQFPSKGAYMEFAKRTSVTIREKKLLANEYRME